MEGFGGKKVQYGPKSWAKKNSSNFLFKKIGAFLNFSPVIKYNDFIERRLWHLVEMYIACSKSTFQVAVLTL